MNKAYTFRIIVLILIIVGIKSPFYISAQGIDLYGGLGATFCDFPDFEKQWGINIRGYVGFTDKFRVAPSFSYFQPEEYSKHGFSQKTTFYEINLDLQYDLYSSSEFQGYPLIGFNISRYKVETDSWLAPQDPVEKTGIGFNLGFGGSYYFIDYLGAFTELKYAIANKDLAHFGLAIGLIYYIL